MNEMPGFRALSLSLRPPRAVVLFCAEADWMHTVERIIELCSVIWGGAGFQIVPCDSQGVCHRAFERVIAAYDPDYFLVYRRNGLDLKFSNPREFERRTVGLRAALVDQDASEADITRLVADEVSEPEPWSVSTMLLERLARRCAPFQFHDCLLDLSLENDLQLPYQLTPAAVISSPEPTFWAFHEFPQFPWYIRLPVYSKLGCRAPHLGSKHYQGVAAAQFRSIDEGDLLDVAWYRCESDRVSDVAKKVDTLRSLFGRSMVGCDPIRSLRPHSVDPWTIVVGDTADDFCLAFCVDRVTARAIWVPEITWRASDKTVIVRDRIHRFLSMASRASYLQFSVTSMSNRDVCAEIVALETRKHLHFPPQVVSPDVVPLTPIVRWLLRDHYRIVRNEPFSGASSTFPIETPMPTSINATPPIALKWIVDINVRDWKPPVNQRVSSLISGDSAIEESSIRCSAAGVSYFSHEVMSVGTELAPNVWRPVIRVPPLPEIFDALAGRNGWRVRTSDKGSYFNRSVALWGGFEQLTADLNSTVHWRLLNSFLQGKDARAAVGIWLAGTRRRYLSFVDAVKVTGATADEMNRILDGYALRGIVTRGIILKCRLCRASLWYPIDELGVRFTCGRCRQATPLASDSWVGTHVPRWYFELQETVYQFLEHNGWVTALTLGRLRAGTSVFEYLPETEIGRDSAGNSDSKSGSEIDIVALRNGRLILGEAKTVDRVEGEALGERRTLEQLGALCNRVVANACIFASSREWRSQTKAAVEREFKKRETKVLYLEGVTAGTGKPVARIQLADS